MNYGLTFAEVNLKNISDNISEIKKTVSENVKIMAIVKADAYGHGAVEVSKVACESGVYSLGVASLREALVLKENGINVPILILSESTHDGLDKIVEFDLIQTIYTYRFAESLSMVAKKLGKKAKVHIKIDTGMGRIGVFPEEAVSLVKKISKLENLFIEGIFTHFSKAEQLDDNFTEKQFFEFKKIISQIELCGIKIPLKHSANTAATIFRKETHLDMVRVGLGMYGLYPKGSTSRPIKLKPALSFKTKIMYLKDVPEGTPISYGGTYVTKRKTKIATLPVGYADGLSRRLSNIGEVLIKGKRFPIVGNITMDMTMVDVGDEDVKIGDEVVLIGRQGSEEITVDEVADLENTINYEIICRIGKRVPRIYLRN